MKSYLIAIISILLLSSCSNNDELKQELVEIKTLLAEINSKLPDKEKQPELIRPASTPYSSHKDINIEALDNIHLPDHPSKKDILKYFREIALATQNQKTFSESDPQVYMLMEVGHENLEYLLSYNTDRMLDMYFTAAIKNLAQEGDKNLIISYLPRKKELVKIIIAKNWHEDAKPILISEMNELPEYLPTEWVTAVASLDEECTYDSLKNYLIYGSNKSWTYKAIVSFTSMTDLDEAVAEAWLNAKKDNSDWSRNTFAPVAASYGHIDALEAIIQSLDSSSNSFSAVRDPRKHIFQLTEARGTNDEIRLWFKQNKSKLIFNKEAGKFIVRQQKKLTSH